MNASDNLEELTNVDTMLNQLEQCGITINPKVNRARLLADQGPFKSYGDLLISLGNETEYPDDPYEFNSDDIWHFDTECIYSNGDYANIAKRMSLMAKGALPIAGVLDTFGADNGTATISFTLDGKCYIWPITVNDDWVDAQILSQFAGLIRSRQAVRQFTYLDLGGQDCLLGCSSVEEMSRLRALTDLNVEWLR